MTKKVTQAQAERALAAVAKWLGKQGMTEDGSPAPTGPEAAMHGLGPELNMEWSWPGSPTPTILLEGGPYDWAIKCPVSVPGLFLEPWAGYALCIYRED